MKRAPKYILVPVDKRFRYDIDSNKVHATTPLNNCLKVVREEQGQAASLQSNSVIVLVTPVVVNDESKHSTFSRINIVICFIPCGGPTVICFIPCGSRADPVRRTPGRAS
ncbi:hypothetical protein J6590_082383 [Homalodisca vitripennis]|nr:hypothetical protein J6590_082383 [Homalodisca vitripennis]